MYLYVYLLFLILTYTYVLCIILSSLYNREDKNNTKQ